MAQSQPLEEFASAATADSQLKALLELLKNKDLHRALETPIFQGGMQRLVERTADTSAGSSRLVALSALGRIGAVAKSAQPLIARHLPQALAQRLPALQLLDDSDGRFYVAGMWRYTRAEWMTTYLAEAAVDEESGENARLEALLGLMTMSGTLAASFEPLGSALSRLRFDTKKPGDSRGRRVRKVLAQTVRAAGELKIPSGDAAGALLGQVMLSAVPPRNKPESPDVAAALVDEVAALVSYVVRSRLSLVTEPETYSALDVARTWFLSSEWPEVAERSAAMRGIAADIKEGLRIVARAGRTDDGLYRALVNATGSDETARQETTTLARDVTGLNESVRAWLVGRTPRRSSEFALAEQARSADEVFAGLLLDAKALTAQTALVTDGVVPELQMISPRTAPVLSRLLGTVASSIAKVELLGAKRGLRIRGDVGAVVEYSPLEHEMVGGFVPGVRTVRLLTPVVEAFAQGDLSRIIRKAMVEPATESNA